MSNENSPILELESEKITRELPRLKLGLTIAVCFSGFILPGLGHILMGRWVRGAILAVAIGLMFLFGLGMQGELYGFDLSQSWLRLFGFFADAGVGVLYWLAE